jgi:hypothetical protein
LLKVCGVRTNNSRSAKYFPFYGGAWRSVFLLKALLKLVVEN